MAAYDQIDEPTKPGWHIPAKSNRFQLYVNSTVPAVQTGRLL